ncbi:hypothetical protein C922_02691 [Plasmodium inui San Antonio 1]|uniref:Uncharacterized protein n=1 Tax=Plasmodium inui San Antonio 1 TaxID=1237626 RepID=W7A1M9_9APIC|nr:hypothetical protein C922_02691 [Plasmodium inui San Antonio 1]EUD67107.1 hypothetical protein C922_02691 [Plasmodium inui San Antonio 1]
MATYSIIKGSRRYCFIHSAGHVQITRKGHVKWRKGVTQSDARHYAVEATSLLEVKRNGVNFLIRGEDSTAEVGLPNEKELHQGVNTSSPKNGTIKTRGLLSIDAADAEIMIHIVTHLETAKKTNRSFLDFLTLSTLHKQEIEKEQKRFYWKDKIRDHLREYLHFAIKNNHYNYLFKIYQLTCLYKIDDLELLRELLEQILIHTSNEEEKVIHCYWIVKELTGKKKHDMIIAVLLAKYLFNDSFFNFLQRNACINTSFVTLLSYVSDSIGYYPDRSVLPSLHCTLKKYARHFNSRLEKDIEPKMVNNVEELAKVQEIFLRNGFCDDDFNLLIKRLVLTSTSYVNPFDLLVLSSNVLLNFACSYHSFLFPSEQQGGATHLEGRSFPNRDNSPNGDNFSKRYRNFLSAKTMTDVVIRTNDPYIANTCNELEYIQRYLLLCSYCHFTLFSNWWADTVIFDRLKKKRRPHKAVVRSRMPYKSHLADQVSHLLGVLLYKYGNSGQKEVHPYVAVDAVQSRPDGNPPECSISKYLPYLLKSFMRVGIIKPEIISNESFILFFEEIFLHLVDVSVAKYKQGRRGRGVDANNQGSRTDSAVFKVTRECAPHYGTHPGDNLKREERNILPSANHKPLYTKDELSLYDLSSICECFFLVKLMQGGVSPGRRMLARKGLSLLHTSSNEREKQSNCPLDKSRDAFEKTLYIFLERLPPSSQLHLNDHRCHPLDKQDILKELINKIKSCAEPVFLYYLLLRTILPILFCDTREDSLDVTKRTISCILSLPFRTNIIVKGSSPSQGCDSTHEQFHHILKGLTQWENCVISINSQRRIRMQTKRKGLPFDFLYAGDFLRPSSIFLLCLNEMVKWEHVYLPFLQEIFISDHFSEGDKASFSDLVRGARDSVDFSVFRFLRERRA